MKRSVHSLWLRYGAAIAAIGLALVIKLLLVPLISQDTPFLLFFIAVMLAAWIGGLGPGLLATVLASLANNYYFIAPYGQFTLNTPGHQLQLVLFVLEGILISVICSRLQAAKRRAEDSALEARDLEKRILEIADAEHRRIGHDLHDGLGQHLTGIAFITKRLEQRLAADHSVFAEDAAKVYGLARTAVEWTHDLSRSLSPPVLEKEGLASALRELAANAERIFNITCVFNQEGDATFDDLQAGVHLYRIAQEAISNAVKHGKAGHVAMHLLSGERAVVMTIIDNGTGFERPASDADGMGLRIMRYRAKMIGATVDVEHPMAGGTAVICRHVRGNSTFSSSANGKY